MTVVIGGYTFSGWWNNVSTLDTKSGVYAIGCEKDGKVKVSLRSRGTVDVRKIAQTYGGGGHKVAAGVNLPGPFENAKQIVLNALAEQLH